MASLTVTALRRLMSLIAALQIFVAATPPASAQDETIAKLRAADRRNFADREIVAGFVKLIFNPEFPFMGRTDRIRKYDAQVRVHIESRAKPDRTEQVREVISDIAAHIQNLDIVVVENRREANMLVALIADRDLPRTIRALQARRPTQTVQRSLHPRCLSEIRRDNGFRIVRSDAVLVADAGDFAFYDCAYAKLLRSLGPINDDPTLPWTIFNHEVRKGFFGVYDQYLLNILYDPRIKPGMTESQVRAVLPEVLPSVRAFVAKANKPRK